MAADDNNFGLSARYEDNSQYKRKEYWDSRYEHEDSYEWFAGYERFRDLIIGNISKTDRILMLGCGNSNLSKEMYDDGYHNIVNTDYSPVCIQKMMDKYSNCPGMTWEVMDIRELKYPQDSFDVVLEKGTIDALLVDEKDPWNISQETKDLVDQALIETSRVLKQNGKFISIAFGQPHFRKPLYAYVKYDWSLETKTFGSFFHYYFYLMTKGQQLSQNDLELNMRGNTKDTEEVVNLIDSDNEDFLLSMDM
ncbi:EEF1A lysine methyltransferase 4-like [Glandiceps talaboti]